VSDCTPATSYGPCQPYATLEDVALCGVCSGFELDGEYDGDGLGPDAELLTQALSWASRRVFMASGYRFFGCCETTIQPCRTSCSSGVSVTLPSDWPWSSWPWPQLPEPWLAGLVPVWACGCPSDEPCSCTRWDRIPLPLLPAREVVAVEIDGVPLDSSAYRLHAEGWLLRVDGGEWPSCQELGVEPGGEGTWTVTYRHGLDLPPEAVPLVAQYACQLAKSCRGDDCDLGPGIRVVQRAGVEFAVAEPSDYRERGLLGFGPLDDWLSLLNAGHVTEPPRIYRPGREQPAPLLVHDLGSSS
jgi:hypothetical protein